MIEYLIPWTIIVGCFIVLTVRAWRRPKTTPNHARLIAKPGATLDLVDDDGVMRAKVILTNIVYDNRRGTSVQFEDYTRYIQERRIKWPYSK